ncbi:MAG: protein kinase [Planctomycetota bacterium]|nr:protein kinase [Planctomycetota bacterium]
MNQNQCQGWWLIQLGVLSRDTVTHAFNEFAKESSGQDLCGFLLALNSITAAQAFDIRGKAAKGPPSSPGAPMPTPQIRPPSSVGRPITPPSHSSGRQGMPSSGRFTESADSNYLGSQTQNHSHSHSRPSQRAAAQSYVNPAPASSVSPRANNPSTFSKSFLRSADVKVGEQIGPYQLIKELGRGGMGVVFEAKHEKLPRPVALKMIKVDQKEDKVALERFEIEARAMNRLRHPNIVEVYDIMTGSDHAYMTMTLVTGGSLAELLNKREDRQLDPQQAVEYCGKIARALHHAHTQSIIHRDLKPANILLTAKNEPLITDFGLAKALDQKSAGLSVTGQFVGTLAYMPPEQANGDHHLIDARSDVYSLGATLFEMLAGQAPFTGENQVELLREVLFSEAPAIRQINPNIPEDIETLIARCLAKNQNLRYSSAEEMAIDCERWLEGNPIHAKPFGFRERWQIWRDNNRVLAKVIPVTIALLLTLTMGFAAWSWRASYENRVLLAKKDLEQANAHADELSVSEKVAQDALKKARVAQADAEQAYKSAVKARNEAVAAKEKALIATQRANNAKSKAQRARRRAERTIAAGFLEKSKTEFANQRWSQAAIMATESVIRTERLAKKEKDFDKIFQQARQLSNLSQFRSGWRWRASASLRMASLVIAASKQANLLAAIEERTILLWDLRSGRQIGRLDGHTQTVLSLAFSKDGAYLASGDSKGECKLWDLESRSLIKSYSIHSKGIMAVDFHPKRHSLLATASLDRSARFIDLNKQQVIKVLSGIGSKVSCLKFSPDGEQFAIGLTDKSARLYQTDSYVEKRRFSGHRNVISALAFSNDGEYFATASLDKSVKFWKLSNGKETRTISGFKGRIYNLEFSPDSQHLSVASQNEGIQLIPVRGKQSKRSGSSLTAYGMCYFKNARGKWLIAASYSNRTVRVLSYPELKVVRAIDGHSGAVTAVLPHPNKKLILSISEDGSFRAWDIQTGRQHRSIRISDQRLSAMALSPDKKIIAVANHAGEIQFRAAKDLNLIRKFTVKEKKDGEGVEVRSLCFSPDNKKIVVGTVNKQLHFLKAKNGAEVGRWSLSAVCNSIQFSNDGRTLLLAQHDNQAVLWELGQKKPARRIKGHRGAVRAAIYKPGSDNQVIATASLDGSIRLWDCYNGQELMRLEGHSSDVLAIAFTKNGQSLASASDDTTARLWDTRTGQLRRILTGTQGPIRCLAFTANDQALITGSANRSLRVWELKLGRETARTPIKSAIVKLNSIQQPGKSPLIYGVYKDGAFFTSRDPSLKVRKRHPKKLHTAFAASEEKGQLLFLCGQESGKIDVWQDGRKKLLRKLTGHSARVEVLKSVGEGELLSGSSDNTMRLWNIAGAKDIQIFKGHQSAVTAVAKNSYNQNLIASGTSRGLVRLFSQRTGQLLFLLEAHRGRIYDLKFIKIKEKSYLASCSEDKTIVLWNVEKGTMIRRFTGHSSAVLSLTTTANKRNLVSSSKDHSIRLWNIGTGQELWRYEGHQDKVSKALYNQATDTLISCSDDKTIRTWTMAAPNGEVLRAPISRLGTQSLAGLRADGFQTVSDDNTHLFKLHSKSN